MSEIQVRGDIALAFDFETTGLPDWKLPSDDEGQPHIVQLAFRVFETASGKVLDTFSGIVAPQGWTIPPETTALHGIDNEKALAEGKPEKEVMEELLGAYCAYCDGPKPPLRVAHNFTFDNRIMRIAMKRFGVEDWLMAAWKDSSTGYCTMREFTKMHGGAKFPKLVEACAHYNILLASPHSADADVDATVALYLELKNSSEEVCQPPEPTAPR